MGTLPSDLTDLVDQNRVDSSGTSDTLVKDENPQHQYQNNSQGESIYSRYAIVRGSQYCTSQREKAFGYNIQLDVKLSPVRYFNQRLLNYTQLYSSEADYIFYALSVSQQLKLINQIIIASKKFCSSHVIAGMLSSKFS